MSAPWPVVFSTPGTMSPPLNEPAPVHNPWTGAGSRAGRVAAARGTGYRVSVTLARARGASGSWPRAMVTS